MNTSITGIGNINAGSIQGLDLETAMLAIQSQRAGLLEGQLTTQLNDVQKKNEQMGSLNDTLNAGRAFMASLTTDQMGAEDFTSMELTADQLKLKAAFEKSAELSGISTSEVTNKSTLDAFINNVKTSVDSLGNSQQMDMLRLQSLSNKRNEAFDLMTNFIKKMQDSRSSIIGNMR